MLGSKMGRVGSKKGKGLPSREVEAGPHEGQKLQDLGDWGRVQCRAGRQSPLVLIYQAILSNGGRLFPKSLEIVEELGELSESRTGESRVLHEWQVRASCRPFPPKSIFAPLDPDFQSR